APEDKGENIRREICLMLEQMGIFPESSYHEEGPGQNEIDFRYSGALAAADNTLAFQTVVRTAAQRNGVWADFSPKPLKNRPGNGFHVNISVNGDNSHTQLQSVIAGIMEHIKDMTVFLNPAPESYERLGTGKAPRYITWSSENRAQFVRIPTATGSSRRAELRSPDPLANPYLVFTLLIYAALDGIKRGLYLPPVCDIDLTTAGDEFTSKLSRLPDSLECAKASAKASEFIAEHLPAPIIENYCK
ncbi:MAG: type I glutamate--ammonia ligase, partial [Ruminococcus sp.]|nr:type I glutamate--ammonia ligase [Ruminococcus sp.]